MKYSYVKRAIQGAVLAGGAIALFPALDVAAQGIGLRKLDQMLSPTSATIERGQKVYAEQCVSCHGEDGKGGAPLAQNFDPPAQAFTGQFKYGHGPIAIYNAISVGDMQTAPVEGQEVLSAKHPAVFNHVPFQDRWAVAHYVRTLGGNGAPDSQALRERAEFEAENGVCFESVKAGIADRVAPKGEEQLAKGKELYAAQCSSCHGAEGKGDGAAAAALNPPPRNFHSVDQKWTVGTSPLGVFNVLSVGIAGTSMASYASLSEDDRWALTHYIRQWVPESQLQESTEEEVVDVCRALSTPPKPPAIPLEVAINALIKDYPTSRAREFAKYGDVLLHPGADAAKGEAVYNASCASCHGAGGVGSANGPYGAFPPYLYLQVNRLVPAMAGGDTASFAQRSIGGVHATLPDMSAASHLTVEDWRNVQAYIARFEGEGTVRVNEPTPPQVDAVEEPATQAPATESVE